MRGPAVDKSVFPILAFIEEKNMDGKRLSFKNDHVSLVDVNMNHPNF